MESNIEQNSGPEYPEIKEQYKKAKEIKPVYMMATKAYRLLGEISRDEPDLCSVEKEDDENYYGHWICGFGFVSVRFPKETIRKLTIKESQHWHKRGITISGQHLSDVRINQDEVDMYEEMRLVHLMIDGDMFDLKRKAYEMLRKNVNGKLFDDVYDKIENRFHDEIFVPLMMVRSVLQKEACKK